MGRCKSCGHSADAHTKSVTNPMGDCVACGCTRFKPRDQAAREARLRAWIANVEFFVRNRWIAKEVRVKAMGRGGAAMRAVREAKQLALRPRQRVQSVRITLVAVPQSRKERQCCAALFTPAFRRATVNKRRPTKSARFRTTFPAGAGRLLVATSMRASRAQERAGRRSTGSFSTPSVGVSMPSCAGVWIVWAAP
jgi:hypothetical protein